ncbi:MAG: hypothetical protein ABI661_08565 [Gammaproteobacteria bacterium]
MTERSGARGVRGGLVAALALVAACARYTPPPPPARRDVTVVDAPLPTTWKAVVAMFAERNVPIRMLDRSTGVIVTEEQRLGTEAAAWADCGRTGDRRLGPTLARYNALVLGDSVGSTVKLTVSWSRVEGRSDVKDCSSLQQYEPGFESAAKALAERGTTPAGPPSGDTAGALPPVAGSGNRRPNSELMANVGFSRVIGDMQRAGWLLGYRESERERLQVDLAKAAFRQPTLDYQLTRLFLAYGSTMEDDRDPLLEIRGDGLRVGTYSRDGLEWEASAKRR